MLKYYRQRKGLTTRQLAESVEVVPATVLMYERGQFPIPYQTAVAMAKVLEIDRNLLFDEFAQFLDYPYSDRLREVRKNMFLQIVKQLAKSEGITEELKAKDQTEWVAQMNNVCYRARGIVNSKLIY